MDNSKRLRDILPVLPKNVGHLRTTPLEITCPACRVVAYTRIEHQSVTVWQQFLTALNKCVFCCDALRCSGAYDINHYCGRCGCYVGRRMTLSWCKRQQFRMQRIEEESDQGQESMRRNRWQHFHRIDKQDLDKDFERYNKPNKSIN